MPQKSNLAVVDASVVLKWQLDDEECVSQAIDLRNDFYLHGIISLVAPQLLIYEIANGIATASRQKRLSKERSVEALSNLLSVGVELKALEPLYILETALKYNIAAYDAAYLALAETEGCDLWTGDIVLLRIVNNRAKVRWIGDYTSPQKA